jgi:hypothetical protein
MLSHSINLHAGTHCGFQVTLNASDLPEVSFIVNERLTVIRTPHYIPGRYMTFACHPIHSKHFKRSIALKATEPNLDDPHRGHSRTSRWHVAKHLLQEQNTSFVHSPESHTPMPIARNLVMGISLYTTVV